jgi:hypothetical protein
MSTLLNMPSGQLFIGRLLVHHVDPDDRALNYEITVQYVLLFLSD